MSGLSTNKLASTWATGDYPPHEREAEFATLRAALSRADTAGGSLIVITGASGAGKSSLLGAASEIAAEEGVRAHVAAGREPERAYTFGLVLQLLESRVADAEPHEHAQILSGAARFAAPLFMEGPRDALAYGQAFSVLHGLYRLCANLAAEQPLVLCVDDAHWADEPSLRFLLYLAQRVAELPIVLVVAAESSGPHVQGELLEEIFTHPAATVHRLRPLTPEGVSKQLRSSSFPNASEDFCRTCFEATGGNPFLLRELTRELASRGIDPGTNGRREILQLAPRSVAVAVGRRVRRIGRGALELAAAVAILGDEAELRHAARLADLDPAEAARIADALVAAEVLRPAERLGFVHATVRAAVYADRTPGQLAEAHLRTARMLNEERVPAERVAAHLLEARRSGDRWAVDVLLSAGAHAIELGNPDSAVQYLRRALEEPPGADRRAQVVLQLGRAEAIAGEPEAVDRLRDAIDLTEEPRERALTALETGRTLHTQGRRRDATEAFARGLDELGDRDQGLRTRLEASQATASQVPFRGLAAATSPAGGKVEATAERVALAHQAFDAALRGGSRERTIEVASRALGDGALLVEDGSDGLSYYLATAALIFAEKLSDAEEALDAAVEDARSRGSVLGVATAHHWRGLVRLRRGRVAGAMADAQEAVAAERYGWRLELPAARGVLAETLVELGDLERAGHETVLAAEAAEEGDDGHPGGLYLAARAHVLLLGGAAAEAREGYLECGRRQHELGVLNPAVVAWRSGAAVAMAQLGEIDRARTLVDEELRLARAFGASGAIGRALHTRGMLEANGKGLGLLREAAEVLERSEAALDHARALVDVGAALRRAGKRQDARDPLRRGLDVAERCGGRAIADRAREELATAGARPRRRALSGLDSLTARERQTAELAAQGMSNRRIAEALFITVKTVEWHLRHTYEKLGVASRQDLQAVLGDATPRGAPS